MEEKKGVKPGIIVVICILCIAIVAPISWFVGKSMAEKQNKMEEKSSNTDKSSEVVKIKKSLFDTTGKKVDTESKGNSTVEKVELTEDNKVLVTMTGEYLDSNDKTVKLDTKNKEVAQKVKDAVLVHVGQSDICEGNAKLVFILEDGTLSYLDVDKLVCGHEIAVGTVSGVSNIVSVSEEKKQVNQYEPYKYTVYAEDKDGKKIDISSKLDNVAAVVEISKVLFDTTSRNNSTVEKVELTTDNKVLVSITGDGYNVNRQQVAENVKNTSLVHAGQKNTCEGNARLMFILNDGTVSYLNIDQLVCGHKVVTAKVNGLTNITEVTEDKKQTNENEPYKYTVYAKDKDGKSTDITDKLN